MGRTLAASGLVEVLSYPFLGRQDLEALGIAADDPRSALVELANPLSDEAPCMRTTLLPGLVTAARRNLSRGAAEVALSEVGLVFRGSGTGSSSEPPRPSVAGRPSDAEVAALEALLPEQPRHAAGLLAGERDRAGWWGAGRPADWSDAIGIVRDLAAELGVAIDVASGSVPPWHPGRCAAISVGGQVIGHAGELHPRVIGELGLPARTVAFEIDLDALLAAAPEAAAAPVFSTMPVAKEDLAVVVADDVPAEDVRRALVSGGGELLESVRLFDTYSGEQVGPGAPRWRSPCGCAPRTGPCRPPRSPRSARTRWPRPSSSAARCCGPDPSVGAPARGACPCTAGHRAPRIPGWRRPLSGTSSSSTRAAPSTVRCGPLTRIVMSSTVSWAARTPTGGSPARSSTSAARPSWVLGRLPSSPS